MDNHPWSEYYPQFVPQTITPNRYRSLADFFEDTFKRYEHRPMLENMGKVLTYREVDQLSQAFAAYLQDHTSLKPGDAVAIQLPNLLQYPVILCGALRAGMVVVNVNPLYTPHEMEHQLQDSQAKAIIVLANFAHNLEKVIAQTAIQTVVTTEVGDLLGGVKKWAVNIAVKHVKKLVPDFHLPGAVSLPCALKIGKKADYKPVSLTQDKAAFLQYTGGTTGVSKGAVLTHHNILANLEQMTVCLLAKLSGEGEIAITPLPLYHIFSLTVNLLGMMRLGAKNVLITNPRDIAGMIKELRKHRFTFISGVNTLFNALLAQEEFVALDFAKLKVAVAGGVALQAATARRWEEVTDRPLIEGYGLTEASPIVACNMLDGTHRKGTVGIPLPSTIVKIVDDEGKEVACNEPGDLLVQGPQIMKEYWQQPEETAQVLVDGWLRTGDIAKMDPNGFVTIVDRKKEMINVSGFNVYPNEIEKVVSEHPKVLEVGAIGMPDKDFKEVIKIYVVKRDPSLTEAALITHCREKLTKYKMPKHIEFRDSLPKSNVGKIMRRVLREEAIKQADNPVE